MGRLFTKFTALFVCAFAICLCAEAGNDRIITVEQLPSAAQQILKKDFSGKAVSVVKMETELTGKRYEVIFNNGDEIEFDSSGNWTEISCKSSQVPARLVPAEIRSYVSKNYPDAVIREIEKDRSNYDVKLSNRLEITFNKNFKVIDID